MIKEIKRFNFEFSKSPQYSPSYIFFLLNHSLEYMPARELNYADNWNFAKICCSFSVIGALEILA